MVNQSNNLTWQPAAIGQEQRHALNGHKSCVIWMTGLSGSGKSSIAMELERQLYLMKIRSYVLDGDNVRQGLNRNLGFSPEDRKENIRRVGELAKLFTDAGLFTISAFISPYEEDRELVRSMFQSGEFIEIYVSCSLSVCESRDPKGLYKKARAGKLPDFTGVSSPYEVPAHPELIVETDKLSLEVSVMRIIDFLKGAGFIK
ncbi:adenylyl-sulfate kinase [Paenibacillus sp. S3N08]|uniref:Adenylyl-sulfate kinase n=2 Tax=Paenibacillus agricola TaxID=2716264 RepID=A0ABX0J6D4_9BACL|nr:adenylyl-sulfate kinase [Paenibacillus agricola]